ncbi:tetratricopeptide repeat protein [Corallincola spongiicola]|uniref:Tetratricopeptide repeat protein n=2 Tax=Corallincola spongiicola TaxID=2520508 RepID=A0ABY1WNR0_9GAMM|nr:tetratricopeptide repeat protein [Corallincola spongiicola]
MRAVHQMFMGVIALLCLASISGCSSNTALHSQVKPKIPNSLWQDSAFVNRPTIPSQAEIFAISPQMQDYLKSRLSGHSKGSHTKLARLIDLLRSEDELMLSYDNRATLTVSEAYQQRLGNCLTLSLLTQAIADAWKLDVRLQQPDFPELWEHRDDIYLVSQHVNVKIDIPRAYGIGEAATDNAHTIDFSGNPSLRYLPQKSLSTERVVAMFYNNRAAQAIANKDFDSAYWLSKAALTADPGFISGYATLGVIYARSGQLTQANQAYRTGLAHQADHPLLLANLAILLERQGDSEALAEIQPRLKKVIETNPFHYHQQGEQAFKAGEYRTALRYYERGLKLSPYIHDLYFGLAKSYYALGHTQKAKKYLEVAMELGSSYAIQQKYRRKLQQLDSYTQTTAALTQ